ncbi:hypothetical protein AQ610_21010 [Burkholderia humptydooensis]|nr:hypothetical protein AQ610_21010 [Burkholderia humptydooensis]
MRRARRQRTPAVGRSKPIEADRSWTDRRTPMLIAPVGMYLRRRLADDAPGAGHHGIDGGALRELFAQHGRTVLLLTLTVTGGTVSTYILTFYMPTYAIHTLGLPMKLSMFVGVASGCVMLATCPLFGWLSDRIGSRRLLSSSGAACSSRCCFRHSR